jgi:hypothetical protein
MLVRRRRMPCDVCNSSGGLDDPPRLPPGFRIDIDRKRDPQN